MKYMYINLDRARDRDERMKAMLASSFPGRTFERVSGVDGAFFPENIKQHESGPPGVNGCVASHVLCMMKLLESDDAHAVVLEDDLSDEYVRYWTPFHWKLFDEGTDECDIVQMCCIGKYGGSLENLERKGKNQWSTVAYVVSREAARRIVDVVRPDGGSELLLDLSKLDNPYADNVLYRMCDTRILPMFTHTRETYSYVSESASRENKKYENWRVEIERMWKLVKENDVSTLVKPQHHRK
jgi:GR25 family glycosyltransferase involved in LPS biosynthesis